MRQPSSVGTGSRRAIGGWFDELIVRLELRPPLLVRIKRFRAQILGEDREREAAVSALPCPLLRRAEQATSDAASLYVGSDRKNGDVPVPFAGEVVLPGLHQYDTDDATVRNIRDQQLRQRIMRVERFGESASFTRGNIRGRAGRRAEGDQSVAKR